MRVLLVLFVIALAAPAVAQPPIRVTVKPNTGELATWPKNLCGREVADNLWRIVFKRPYIEIIDGKFAARIDEKLPVPAARQMVDDVLAIGFYDPSDTRTIAFTVHLRGGHAGMMPIEISIIVRDPNDRTKACRETWTGLGEKV
jgi:hypothetical protein